MGAEVGGTEGVAGKRGGCEATAAAIFGNLSTLAAAC